MLRIPVSNVALAREPKPALDRAAAVPALLGKRVEQLYESDAELVSCKDYNALAQAAHDAFYEHRPLVVTPDAVWFCLAQGFALHVNQNVEKLRQRFVRHEGKLELIVRRLDFRLGKPNPWPEAFAAFSNLIAAHVGKVRALVAGEFTTTGPSERAALDVVVMDAFQGYFKYVMMVGCGIPEIILLGTPADWRSVRTRAAVLGEYGLEHWTRVLLPVLDRIVATAEGEDQGEFWRSFFHYQSLSRPAKLTGWINVLFPYLKGGNQLVENPFFAHWENVWKYQGGGPPIEELPSSLASAPVLVIEADTGRRHDMRFVGGMFGVVQDRRTLALAPEFGWAIVYD